MPLTIQRNDLADVSADCIVIPANPALVVTGGVGYAVAKRAGLRKVNRDVRPLAPLGYCEAVATPAHRLAAEHLVHIVTPIWNEADVAASRDDLHRAYQATLDCCLAQRAESIALPLLGTGLNGTPPRESLLAAREILSEAPDDLEITLVLFGSEAVSEGNALFGQVKEYIDDCYIQQQQTDRPFSWIEDFGRPDTVIEALGGQSTLEVVFEEAAEPVFFETAEECGAVEGDGFGELAEEKAAICGSVGRKYAKLSSATGAVRDAAAMDAAPAAAAPKNAGSASASTVASSAAQSDAASAAAAPMPSPAAVPSQNIEDLLAHLDESFSTTVLALIDQRGLTDAEVYKRANLSRQHFSKIRSNPDYRPTKRTVLALAIALELDLAQTEELLARAGFALSHASKADVIVEFFINRGIYDIFQINEMLFSFDQPLLA